MKRWFEVYKRTYRIGFPVRDQGLISEKVVEGFADELEAHRYAREQPQGRDEANSIETSYHVRECHPLHPTAERAAANPEDMPIGVRIVLPH